VGAAFGGESGRHGRRVREGGAGPARPPVRAEHASLRAPRLRRSAPVSGGAQTDAGTARSGNAERSCQPGVNGRCKRSRSRRVSKVKRPRFLRAFSSVARGRNYTWTAGFAVPIEVRVAYVRTTISGDASRGYDLAKEFCSNSIPVVGVSLTIGSPPFAAKARIPPMALPLDVRSFRTAIFATGAAGNGSDQLALRQPR